jgi:hypothetical protein
MLGRADDEVTQRSPPNAGCLPAAHRAHAHAQAHASSPLVEERSAGLRDTRQYAIETALYSTISLTSRAFADIDTPGVSSACQVAKQESTDVPATRISHFAFDPSKARISHALIVNRFD